MSLFRIFAAGALGYVAYRAWQRRQSTPATPTLRDDGGRTPPHGDPVLVGESLHVEPVENSGAQSSRGFGEP